MKSLKQLFLLAFCALAALPTIGQAANSVVVLNQQFNDVNSLSGWTLDNASNPPGLNWFQGNPGVFEAHQGAPNAYIAANYLSAGNGSGTIDNWLITPQLSLLGPTALSFYARAPELTGFADTLEIRFGSGGNFSTVLATLGANAVLENSWQGYIAVIDFTGTGQFAFRYVGDAATSNYIGLDTVLVSTVPEPSAWMLYLGGALALAVLGRRRYHPS
jgi:hypothetical protein